MRRKLLHVNDINDVNKYSISQSDLITNIIEHRWNTVDSILRSNQLIQEINKTNNSSDDPHPLHIACSQSSVPYEVIVNLLHTYGKSCCLIEDEDGSLPIHIAYSTPNIDLQILQLLLETSPETGER